MNNKTTDESMRLNRYLARCGVDSRRKADEIIKAGHVYINGKRITELGCRVVPNVDKVELRGKEIRPFKTQEYYAMFKPREVIVTKKDPEGRTTVYDILHQAGIREAETLVHVGRLDYQSEGLLLFTNDGDLVHAITHPRYSVKKVYQVKIDRKLSIDEIKQMTRGIESQGQVLHAGDIRDITVPMKDRKQFWYEVDLYEGKNRQLRRMFEFFSIHVGRLRRVKFSSVKIEDMVAGDVRKLSQTEIAGLRAVGHKISKRKSSPVSAKK